MSNILAYGGDVDDYRWALGSGVAVPERELPLLPRTQPAGVLVREASSPMPAENDSRAPVEVASPAAAAPQLAPAPVPAPPVVTRVEPEDQRPELVETSLHEETEVPSPKSGSSAPDSSFFERVPPRSRRVAEDDDEPLTISAGGRKDLADPQVAMALAAVEEMMSNGQDTLPIDQKICAPACEPKGCC